MAYLMGIDVGTSSTKVLVIEESGRVVAEASHEYPISTPKEGWAEQDPELWWKAFRESIRKISESVLREVVAIGLSGQMHGTVVLDRFGRPLRPAVIWADRRSLPQCREIYARFGRESVLELVCNPMMPGFMGPTLLWLLENEPQTVRDANVVLLPKDYVRLRLTGSVATDVSDASATLLFDVKARRWAEELVSSLGIPLNLLPEVLESTDVAGEVTDEASEETGLSAGIPVIVGGGDSQVGAVGCGAVKEGLISSNIGTGGQVFATINHVKVDPKHRVHTFCHAVPGRWCLQGAILSAGLSLRWFRDNLAHMEKVIGDLCSLDPYELLSMEAEAAEPGCRGLIFLPYLLGERSPHMNPNAKGVLFGLTIEHRRAHIIRAIMEGVVYALKDSLEVFKELSVRAERVISRGGGAVSRLWRRIQADVFGVEVVRCKVGEEAALGAALLAGVGVNVYRDVENACSEAVKTVDTESPNPENVKIYEHYYSKFYRRLYPTLEDYWRGR